MIILKGQYFFAWNRVYVDGQAYLVDCCWGDAKKDDTYFLQKEMRDRKED